MLPEERSTKQNQPNNLDGVSIDRAYDQRGQTIYGDQINVAGNVLGDVILKRLDPDDIRNHRNHSTLRQMVRSFWIDGVLKHSLYNEILIRLNIKNRPDLVDSRPWDLILHRPDLEDESIPPNTPVIDIFDQMGQRLLILGEPGSGKTVMLLELADALLDRSAQDLSYPTPVVFNLSSWGANRKPLDKWLIDELRTKYNIPRKIAQRWIEEDELIPLLDGLDEVKEQAQIECVKAINNFIHEHLTPLVICSRRFEYEKSFLLLKLQGAVTLEHLTDIQIESYLGKLGTKLPTVNSPSNFDQQLHLLMRSPLMLSIVTLAYIGLPSTTLTVADTIEARRKYILDAYIRRMLVHRKHSLSYDAGKILVWLNWLSKHIVQNQLSIFFIEYLQPHELRTRFRFYLYILCTRLASGYLFGALCSLIVSLYIWLEVLIFYPTLGPFNMVFPVILMGNIFGLIAGTLATGFTIARCRRSREHIKRKRQLNSRIIVDLSMLTIIAMPLYIFITERVVVISAKWNNVLGPDIYAIYLESMSTAGIFLSFQCVGLAMIWIVKGRIPDLYQEIQPVEGLALSWIEFRYSYSRGRKFQRKLEAHFWGILIALLNIIFSISIIANHGPLSSYLCLPILIFITSFVALKRFMYHLDHYDNYIFGSSIIGLILGTITMLRTKSISNKTSSNQGIWLSAKNALKAALLGVVLIAGIIGSSNGILIAIQRLPDLPLDSTLFEVIWAMLIALGESIFLFGLVGVFFLGPLFFIWFGGLTVIQHIVLRGLLQNEDSMPWNFTHFLDHCVDLIFLRQVGGGYIFIHRLLMEHFASLTDEDIKRITAD